MAVWKEIRADGSTAWKARVGSTGPLRTFDRRDDADEYESEQKRGKRRAKAGLEAQQQAIKYAELYDLWKANFSPSEWRLNMAAHSLRKWGDVYLHAIKPEGVGSWLHGLTKQDGSPLAGKTKSHILETMRQILNAGIEWGYLQKSPARARAFKAPSQERQRPIRPFESWAEVERVCEHLSPTGIAIVKFAAATGARLPGEVIDLDWRDISTQRREVVLHGTKTDRAPRTVPMSRHAFDALIALPRSITGRVFIGKTGGRFDYHDWRKTEWQEALALAGLDFRTPYECRHTFATLALQHGAVIEDVSKVLGHKDITVTLDYYRKWTRPMADRLRTVLNSIGEEQHEEVDASHPR